MKYNKIMKNIITVFVFLILLWGSLFAADTTWGDSLTEGVRESSTTGLFTPARYAVDAEGETYWALAEGESEGWIEQYWEKEKYIKGVVINLETKENTAVTLYYDQNGTWVPIPGGTVQGKKSGTVELSFTEDLKKTKRVLVTLRGSDAGSAKFYSITWKEEGNTKRYGKILPESYTFSHTEYINVKPSRLWNGILSNTWFEPIWSIPWEVQQAPAGTKPAGVFAPYMGNPAGNGEIIWTLDGEYNIQTLKAYFSQGWRSIAFEFWNGSGWTDKQTFSGNNGKGWHRIDLKKEITTTKIRVSFPGGWELARYIHQIEVWGEGERVETVRSLALSGKDTKENYQGTITDCDNGLYSLEYIVEGRNSTPVQNIVNGKSSSVTCAAIVGNDSVFVKQLTKDDLRSGTQFVSINTGNAALRGAVLRKIKDKGQILLGSHYTDGFTGIPVSTSETAQKEKKFILDREYNLEFIQVYSPAGIPVKLYTDAKKKNKVDLQYNTKGYWAGSLKGLKTDTIILTTDQPVLINEIGLFGSPESDTEVSLELWWPGNGTQITGQGKNGDCLIGWMGDPLTKPVINGEYYPRQMGNLFWMPLSQMQEVLTNSELYSVAASLNGKSSVKKIQVPLKKGSEQFKLDNASCEYVSGTGITISGSVSKKNTRCLINGKEVGISNNKFSTFIEVPEGYNIITVELWDKNLKKRLSILEKEVYRSFENPIVTIDSPYGSMWTQNSSVLLSGRVGNGEDLRVYVDGVEALLDKDRYAIEKTLQEGNQTIHVVVKDNLNRTSEQTITLLRDSTVPVIQLQHPHEQEYIAHSDIEFVLDGNPDESLWWQFNTEPWEAGTEAIKKKTYILEDNYYTFTIQAQDRSGNKSSIITVNFCVDITPPKNFTIKDNVEGWTNNNTPIIEFATSDATAGVDYYEYKIDEEQWSTVESPFILPVLEDGIREIYVRAVDRAGNKTEEKVTMYIDTSLPPAPQTVRPVPSDESITMKWVGIDDGEEFQEYRIERNPAWSDGVRDITGTTYGKNEYTDTEVEKKQLIYYRVWAVDRAGNESSKSEWYGAQVGLASTPIDSETNTFVEFDRVVMNVPQGATAEDIVKIQMNELPLNALIDEPENHLVSKIYQVTVVRSNGIEETTGFHADLYKEVAIEIGFNPSQIPEEFSVEDIKPYYFDNLWGYWLPIENSYVNTQNNSIIFKTTHFTDFSLQVSKEVILTHQEMIDGSYNPIKTNIGHGDVTISGETGGVSTSFTELVLPGKEGLDLVLQRVYNTGAAQKDTYSASPQGIDGATPWKIANGWEINMPSLQWNGSELYIKDLDGNSLSFGQMSYTQTSPNGANIIIEMENHEYNDQKVLFEFEKKDHYLYLPWTSIDLFSSYKFLNAKVIMSDGRSIKYDAKGRVENISSKSGLNTIGFQYSDEGIIITDTHQRRIVLYYNNKWNKNIQSIIQLDTLSQVAGYAISGGYLVEAFDQGRRKWEYGYDYIKNDLNQNGLKTKVTLENPPEGYTQPSDEIKNYRLLSIVQGLGIGITKLEYKIIGGLAYYDYVDKTTYEKVSETHDEDDRYNFKVEIEKFFGQGKTVYLNNSTLITSTPIRSITYEYTIGSGQEKQFPVSKTVINDGRQIDTISYSNILKTRVALSEAPEAIRVKSPASTAAVREEKKDLLTYEAKRVNSYYTVDTTTWPYRFSFYIYSTKTKKWNTTLMRVEELTDCRKMPDTGNTNNSFQQLINELISIEDTEEINEDYDKKTNFTYDIYGSITKEQITTIIGGRITTKTTSRTYPTLTEKPSFIFRYLPAETTITSSGTNSVSSTTTVVTEKFTYTNLGQISTNTKKLNGQDCVWTYTYNGTGEIDAIISPDGQTKYVYDYSQPSEYSIAKKQINLEIENGTKVETTSTQVFNKATGNLISHIDADRFVTKYEYDSLGRLTNKRIEFIKIENAQPTLIIEPMLTVTYDDTKLTSTVTNENGGITKNQFDNLGRLTAIHKTNTTNWESKDANGNTAITEKVENTVTGLDYDGYDQVISVKGPVFVSYPINNMDEFSVLLNSHQTQYEYDQLGRVIRTINPEGKVKQYRYDSLTNVTTITDETGLITKQQSDWNGNVILTQIQKENDTWIQTKQYYDGSGRIIEKVDGNGNSTKITYNSLGLEEEITPPSINMIINNIEVSGTPKTKKTYSKSGFVTSISSGYSTSTTITNYEVNALGWILKTTINNGLSGTENKTIFTSNTYDNRGNIVKETSGYTGTNETLHSRKWTYDYRGNVLTETNEEEATTSYSYDNAGNKITVTDPRNFTLKMEYDQFNRLIKAWLPENSGVEPSVILSYDARGNLVSRKDPEGVVSTYEYNKLNLITYEKVGEYSKSTVYDFAGRVTSITDDSTGLVRAYSYDKAGRLLNETTDGGKSYIVYTYDDNGNVIYVKDQEGNYTVKDYNALNQIVSISAKEHKDDNKSYRSTYQYYDAIGNIVKTIDGNGGIRNYTYDLVKRLTKEVTNLNRNLSYEYDAWGNVTKFIDANGTKFTREYSNTNKLILEKAESNNKTESVSYDYDEGGAVKSITNDVETIKYNIVNGIYTPNPYDQITSMSWSNIGVKMEYRYDDLKRLTYTSSPNMSVNYTYNTNSQVTKMSGWISDDGITYENSLMKSYTLGNAIKKNITYDDQDRVGSIRYDSYGNNIALYSYEYDYVSNITTKKTNASEEWNNYEYDVINQLIKAEQKGKFIQDPEFIEERKFGFSDLDFFGDITPEYKELKAVKDVIKLDTKRMSISYDLGADRLISKIGLYPKDSGHRVRERDVKIYYKEEQTSANEAKEWKQVDSNSWIFVNDDKNESLTFFLKECLTAQFIKVVTIWDDIDINNDRVDYATFTNVVKNLFKVWTVSENVTEEYSYDANGNRTRLDKSYNNLSKTNTYTYYPNTNGSGNSSLLKSDGTWYYTYDANGNRIMRGKKVDVNGNIVTNDTTAEYWVYTWDLHNRLTKVEQFLSCELNNTVVSYTYDALNYRITRTGKDGTTRYAYGRNGALTYEKNITTDVTREYAYLNNQIIGWQETDNTGNSVKRYATTDLLGSVTTVTDESGKVLWSGEYTAFGNVAYGSGDVLYEGMYTGKDIDSETGLTYHWNRWRSEDGSSFISEDPARDGSNWYGYCGNNPINFQDPTGLYVIVSYFNETTERIEYAISFQNKITNYSRLISNFIPFGNIVPIMQNKLFDLENKVKGNHYYIEYDSDIKVDVTGLAGNILSLTPIGKANDAVKLFDYYKTSQGLLSSFTDTQKDKDIMNFLGVVTMPVLKDIDNKEDAIRLSKFIIANIYVYEQKGLDKKFTEKEWMKIVRSKYFNEDQENIEIYDSVIEGIYE